MEFVEICDILINNLAIIKKQHDCEEKNMNDGQALVSAAMLEAIWSSRKKDMIDLITPFILYAVAKKTSPGEQINTKAVQKYVQVNYAYPDLPESIIKAALSRNPQSAIKKNNKKFVLAKPLDDEVSRMDQRERECTENISKIGNRLSQYLSTHCKKGVPVLQDNAISKLHSFFARYGLQVGTENLANVNIKPEEYESDYYIARFIFALHDAHDALYLSLIDLVKGYFLRLAIYIQPENGNIQAASFANTSFILDTPVLLDLLGYQGDERKNNATSLIRMLQRQKAKLYYFPHIKQEIIDVLTAYKYSLITGTFSGRGKTLEGLDCLGFSISDVEREIQILESKLEGSFDIIEQNLPAYATKSDDTVDESQVLDEEGIKQYVKENTPHYTDENLNNDITSVLAVHKLRAGKTSRNIESCHFVFVTNNIDFIHAFNKYYHDNVDKETFQLAISVNSLSAIAWIKCGEVERLSETELLKNAYCAMQPIPEIMAKLEDILAKLRESGSMRPEQVVALRASRVFQNDLWVNSFGDLEAVNEHSVKHAQEKYEETLIAEEAEKHKKELQEIGQHHSTEIEAIKNEMLRQEEDHHKEIREMTQNHSDYVRKRNEEDTLKAKKRNEDIRKKADEYARNARENWIKPRIMWINIITAVFCLLGIAGLFASISFAAPLWVSTLLGVFLFISIVSVYDTVSSKKKFIVTCLEKKSYAYETRVREEKIKEYSNVLKSQESVLEDEVDQFVGV